MSPKSVSFLAIALVAILAVPVMSAVADADVGQSSGFYRDQLDANGQGLYDEVEATLAALEEVPVNEAKISYTMSSVPSTEADAVSYAQSVVSDALAALGEREKRILAMRYYDGKTQMEVAREIHISQAQVSRLEKNALTRIKKSMFAQ